MEAFFQSHRWARILLRVVVVLFILMAAIAVFAALFLRLWPAFGGSPDREDRERYALRADNYADGAFFNPGEFSVMTRTVDPYADRTTGKGTTPKDELPIVKPSLSEAPERDELTVTWLGHSTCFVQMHRKNLLFDPVLSDIASPVSFVGSWRFSGLPMTARELPEIDAVIITHDHYDHLDYGTIREIDPKVARYIVPLGIEKHLERWGVAADRIEAVAWWEEIDLDGLTVACVPSRHYSGRKLLGQNATLWASWVLKDEDHTVFESGDTGYGDQFEAIHERYGDFTLALTDCAQYSTRWHDVHMFPEEAIEAARILGAKTVMPIHWGAFRLANHAWDDPVERFTLSGEEKGLTVLTPRLGETLRWNECEAYQERWWRELR